MGVNIIRLVCTFGQVGSVVLTLMERMGGEVYCVACSMGVVAGFVSCLAQYLSFLGGGWRLTTPPVHQVFQGHIHAIRGGLQGQC